MPIGSYQDKDVLDNAHLRFLIMVQHRRNV